MKQNTHADLSQRFIFIERDIRGDFIHLEQSYQTVLAAHDHPPVIQRLLGEFLIAASLLSRTLKFEGRLILQARSESAIGLIMAEATHDGKIRGIARPNGAIETEEFEELFKGGSLAVTIEPSKGERYQSLVPLQGENLAACLEHYFRQSEQLNTCLQFEADGRSASGLLLQQLPRQLTESEELRENQWSHVKVLARTVKREELLSLDAERLLNRLYVEDPIRLLTSHEIQFACSCSEERMAKALLLIDAEELDVLLNETPDVELQCEFCSSAYVFTRDSLTALMRGDKPVQ